MDIVKTRKKKHKFCVFLDMDIEEKMKKIS